MRFSIAPSLARSEEIRCRALSILTVSDQLVTGERATAQERLTAFTAMMEIALACLKSL